MSINDSLTVQILAALLGLIFGSFLNVLSVRTLQGKSIIWPPSHCPLCQRRLPFQDNIPLVSFVLLRGRCRFCREKISWQYPMVELATAMMFLIFYKQFGFSWYCLGMLTFGCTLIAVSVTDFKEKLIPHDITYPSMLLGLLFSTVVRQDLLGSMAGVGASYILFDFLAHYGLKIYTALHGEPATDPAAEGSDDVDDALQLESDASASAKLDEFEVMGGGDAVLAAVISAWLGWQRLVVAITIGFIVGTLMGMILLVKEMRQANILHQCLRPGLAGAILGAALLALPLLLVGAAVGLSASDLPWLSLAVFGALGGALLGIVSVGTRVSKPFPFGPALAVGGFVAVFWDPIGLLLKGGA